MQGKERAMAKGKMVKAEVIIDEVRCRGCKYCEQFCPRGCIVIRGDKFTPEGYLLPEIIDIEKCNACGVCVWICPSFAVEVYRWVGAEEAKAG